MDNYIDSYYEQEWNELTPIITKSEETDQEHSQTSDNKANNQKVKRKSTSPILTLQLVVCLFFLIVLFTFKTFAFNLYSAVKSWYDCELTASLYFSGDFSDMDYSGLFSSTADET